MVVNILRLWFSFARPREFLRSSLHDFGRAVPAVHWWLCEGRNYRRRVTQRASSSTLAVFSGLIRDMSRGFDPQRASPYLRDGSQTEASPDV